VAAEALRRTPLYEEHKALGARLVDFAGWEMPVQYEGIKAEHEAVRTRVGLFDVSHMGEVVFKGPQAEEAVQRLVTRDVSRLAVGQAGYAAVCYESGGTVDDVLIYRTQDGFLVVVNASNREKDVQHFEENTGDLEVEVADESDEWALLALQGPEAAGLLQPFTGTDLSSIKYYRYEVGEVGGAYATISRTGYTGEDGFELYVGASDAGRLWTALLEAGRADGVAPIGLGARDTLRLEMRYALYGNDIDDTTNPLEAGLGWVVKPAKGEFLGREAIERVRAAGPVRKLVGLEMTERAVARHGYPVVTDATTTGIVTSGSYGPSVDRYIALAYVGSAHAGVGTELGVEIRGQVKAARVVKTPFHPSRVKKG
jgi:aminomethyltransferase